MITADKVSKYYGARRALADVGFSIAEHEVVGFLGLNGAGKTTVLKILCGLLIPSAGKVLVDGVDGIATPRELRKKIGFLPDRPPLYPELTVRQMLTYAGRLNGVAPARIASRVDEVMALADLSDVADDMVEWLSHGYRQRVGIAQAIVHEPRLVVLDEPISGLDLEQSSQRFEILVRGDVTAAAKAELARVAGVVRIEAQPAGKGMSKLVVNASDVAREELVRALVTQGFGVRQIVDEQGGLEGVFLTLTGKAAA